MADTKPRTLGDLFGLAQMWIDEAFSCIGEDDPDYDAAVGEYNAATAAIATLRGGIGDRTYHEYGVKQVVVPTAPDGRDHPGAARQAERGPVEGNALVGKDQPAK